MVCGRAFDELRYQIVVPRLSGQYDSIDCALEAAHAAEAARGRVRRRPFARGTRLRALSEVRAR
jgi:hypothetical protein